MPSASLNTHAIEQALNRLGQTLTYPRDIELLLVGGAAAMLTGLLPPTRTTTDCDVMVYTPPEAMFAVESAADSVAADLGLAPRWLNSDVQVRIDALPTDWMTRRVFIGQWGRLRVWAVSRTDLIAMKVLAGRAQDLEDLRDLRPSPADAGFVREYLHARRELGTDPNHIDEALELLNSLKLHARE